MVLGVNTADAKDKVVDLLEESVDFPNILDTTMDAWTAMAEYETLVGMTAVPMTYIIDRKGKVMDAWYGYEKGKAAETVGELKLDES